MKNYFTSKSFTPTLACREDWRPACVSECAECTKLAQDSCQKCASIVCASAAVVNGSRPIRWLHIPKCGSTFGITILRYACPELPAWHTVYMAKAKGSIDVRMAYSVDARFSKTGSRCQGRLLLPLVEHYPVLPDEVPLPPTRPASLRVSAISVAGAGHGRHRASAVFAWWTRCNVPTARTAADLSFPRQLPCVGDRSAHKSQPHEEARPYGRPLGKVHHTDKWRIASLGKVHAR